MSLHLSTPTVSTVDTEGRGGRRRWRRAERRRLARHDTLSVRLTELHRIRELLDEASVLVSIGWIQNAWFAVVDDQGRQQRLTAYDIHAVHGRTVSGVCLVGGIVHAAGGPEAARSQLVQRSLDLTWHALNEDPHQPVRWCPGPVARAAHVRDLTRWNDHPQRTARQVCGLLEVAVGTADAQIALRRSEQLVVA